jgi:glycosyltransferase involved in cell wall biosynthesis
MTQDSFESSETLATVVIGRNEGARLRLCLQSVLRSCRLVVYVDSGSTDGSPEYAASLDCRVLRLDESRPLSAARARNEGFEYLMEIAPHVSAVQFLDGDCELVDGWLQAGLSALSTRDDVAIVCGHVHEANPRATIYNLLCELEWQQEPGEVNSAGGRFMVRADAFRAVEGFRCDLIAGEDPEFCFRVRALGWKILHLDNEMARHDVAMTRFAAWCSRVRRSGHAYAQGAAMHGSSPERYSVRDCRRIWVWGLAFPLSVILLAFVTRGFSLILLAAYPLQAVRIYQGGRKRGWLRADALIYACFTVLDKFPAMLGFWEYHWRSWRGRSFTLIEYKH